MPSKHPWASLERKDFIIGAALMFWFPVWEIVWGLIWYFEFQRRKREPRY